jgi:hypothetical protein
VISEEHVTTTERQNCWRRCHPSFSTASGVQSLPEHQGEGADDHGVGDPLVVCCVRLRMGNPPTASRMNERKTSALTKCCDCLRSEGSLHYSRPVSELTRTEQLAYLRAEHVGLLEQLRTLRSEFEALRSAPAPQQEWTAYCQRIEAYKNLLANHCTALEWTRYPPCGRTNVPSPLRHLQIPFLAPSQPPRARAVAQQDKAADRAVA